MHILHTVLYVISERVNKVVEWKERGKEGTYAKRAMWWRDKIILVTEDCYILAGSPR